MTKKRRNRKNDGAIAGVGGSLTLLKGEHRDIQMVREVVQMTLDAKGYQTTVDFVFKNHGTTNINVQMGFPETGSGDVDDNPTKSAMAGYSTWVDGAKVPVKWVPVKTNDSGEYKAHWIKTVPFKAGQTRKIRVQYRSDYGTHVGPDLNKSVAYDFTGGNWKDKVEQSELQILFKRGGSWILAGQITPSGGEMGAVKFVQKGNLLTKVWTNWEAQADFFLSLGQTLPEWRTTADYSIPSSGIPASKVFAIDALGSNKEYDWLPPVIGTGAQTLVSIEAIEAILGVPFSNEEFAVTVAGKKIVFKEGERSAMVEGKETPLTVAPVKLKTGMFERYVSYVPLNTLCTLLGKSFTCEGKHSLTIK
jgi:hypothetical protein